MKDKKMEDKKNVYGVVLAGGVGARMGNVEKPKQFMEVAGKPILVLVLEKFAVHPGFDQVLVLSPKQWIRYTEDLIQKYIPQKDRVIVLEGATDTIVQSVSHNIISDIPDRSIMYQGQTPQSFKAKKLKKVYESLTAQEKEILTDACKIFVIKGEEVRLVQGEVSNIKITYPYDLKVAESLIC